MSDEDLKDAPPEQIAEDEEVPRLQFSARELLPVELFEETQEAFGLFSDAEGHLNIRHLYGALRSMGIDATDKDVMVICETHDPDGRGYVDLDQWTVAVARRLAEDGDRRKSFRARLAAGDKGKTGQVTIAHARTVIETFDPAAVESIDIEEMLDSVNYADLGLIDIDEFMDTMVRPLRIESQQ
ncbi:EF-hand domain pair [Cinara cedri]|uniref:EF-hand domain pair n=1 Tax=Cinara cedri TaxID=506608 RepID=A0A5E4MX62_9HEMI|nr:EF-hand domain pair [Cinara cedri]